MTKHFLSASINPKPQMVKNENAERQESEQALERLRFLGHSLTSFGHDSAASVTCSGGRL